MGTPNQGFSVVSRQIKTIYVEDPYPVAEDTDLLGGTRVVANAAALGSIPSERTKLGMLAIAADTLAVYQLQSISPSPVWVALPFGVTSTYQTVAALIAGPAPASGAIASTQGYYAAGDGGSNTFIWNAASTATANGGTILQIIGVMTGRWLALNQASANVLQFGVKCDSTSGANGTDNTTIYAAMVSALNEMIFPAPGTSGNAYAGSVSVRKSNFTIRFEGKNVILRSPAGTNYPGGALELGNTALGNSAPAYTNISLIGSYTLDGNHANATTPGGDVTGWAFVATNTSRSNFGKASCINAWNGGAGVLINSDDNEGDFFTSGNLGTNGEPGLDLNSSHDNQFTHRSNSDQYGLRLLDNCWGNTITSGVYNSVINAATMTNQTVNQSYANTINLTLRNPQGNGLVVSTNFRSSTFNVVAYGCAGPAVIEQGVTDGILAANVPSGNTYNVCSYNGQVQSCRPAGNSGNWNINSNLDGRSGAQGTNFAVENFGNQNKFRVNLQDSSTWQVRGFVHRNGANDNELVSYNFTNTQDPYNDAGGGLRNRFNHGDGLGSVIPSASVISFPVNGSVFPISGNLAISQFTAATNAGRKVTLLFQGTSTIADVTGGGNTYLPGSTTFSPTAGSSLTISCNGVNWFAPGVH